MIPTQEKMAQIRNNKVDDVEGSRFAANLQLEHLLFIGYLSFILCN